MIVKKMIVNKMIVNKMTNDITAKLSTNKIWYIFFGPGSVPITDEQWKLIMEFIEGNLLDPHLLDMLRAFLIALGLAAYLAYFFLSQYFTIGVLRFIFKRERERDPTLRVHIHLHGLYLNVNGRWYAGITDALDSEGIALRELYANNLNVYETHTIYNGRTVVALYSPDAMNSFFPLYPILYMRNTPYVASFVAPERQQWLRLINQYGDQNYIITHGFSDPRSFFHITRIIPNNNNIHSIIVFSDTYSAASSALRIWIRIHLM